MNGAKNLCPTVPRSPPQSLTPICLTLQGPPSLLMTAVLRSPGRERTAFGRPVPSRALGSRPVGPCGGPVRLRTLVDPETANQYGRIPLYQAAQYEREEVVRILLERNEVNPAIGDEDDQTPLSYAVQYGREGNAEILLKRNDVYPDRADKYSRTPLWWAMVLMRWRIRKFLQDRKGSISTHVASIQPTELFPTEQSGPSRPPFKRTSRS